MPSEAPVRRFKSPYWDVPPIGFEHVTPKKYKEMQAAGQVPQSVVNPSSQHLQGTKYAHPTPADPMAAARAAAAIINAQILRPSGAKTTAPAVTRQARRLYVGNIPFGCTDDELIEFFRTNMETCNFIKEQGNPVLACQINLDKNFAFLEFRTIEETTSAMALDGVLCKGQALKIRRPHDYQPVPGSEPTTMLGGSSITPMGGAVIPGGDYGGGPHIPGVVSSIVADSPNKIYIGGILTHATDEQIKELLSTFGPLRAFNLIRDPITMASKGYAFCEYLDPAITEQAILGLNGFDIGGKSLIVQRASVGSKSGPHGASQSGGASIYHSSLNANPISIPPVQIQVPGLPSLPPTSAPRVLTEVLCLMNMVMPNELRDDEEYQEILEDVEEECKKYGRVRSIEIPRPPPGRSNEDEDDESKVPGLGKVFVEFDSPTEAQRAQQNLAGRRFANRIVVTSYFDRDRYRNKEF